MDTKKLRQKILDLAIHGKLVPQDPNDEPASVLLERIRAEKEHLMAEGKIKRSRKTAKTTDTHHYEQDMPFEVPKGWVWTTIGELFQHNNGKQKTSSSQQGTLHRYITTSNVYWDRFDLSKIGKMFFSDSELDKYSACEGDLLVCEGGDIGRAAIWNYDYTICIQNHLHRLRAYVPICTRFFLYSLMDTKGKGLIRGKGIGLMSLSANDLHIIPTVLPPLTEQERIVAEIERWFKLIDVIEQGKSDLQSTIKQTKNKILDLAIHGKLVAQDPNDEPASELLKRINPKAEITCDNGHYPHLPKGWAYCTLENVCNIHDNKRKAINATERAQRTKGKDISKLFPYFGATGQAGYIDEYLIDGRYILLGEDGAPFLDIFAIKAYEVNGKCWVNNHAHILEPLCDFEYIKFVLNGVDYSDYVNGSTRLKLTQTDMRVLKIPLPPIEEQKRIVVAIAKLFNMLDAIKENL